MRDAIAGAGLKAAPPVTIVGFSWISGLTLNEWVWICTLVYLGLQSSYLLWKWVREIKK